MEVILKKQKTIMEQVAEAKANAAKQDREIETIKLTGDEVWKMVNELSGLPYLQGIATGIARKLLDDEKVEVFLLGVPLVYDPKEDEPTG